MRASRIIEVLAAALAIATTAVAAPTPAPPLPAGASSALPPGHPPIDAQGADDDDGALPPGHPDTSTSAIPGLPDDGSTIDRDLPPGTIVVEVRDPDERPVPNADVTLGIVQQSVAKGESRKRVVAKTDGEGRVRWDGQSTGSGFAYRTSVAWSTGPGGEAAGATGTFAAMPFNLDLAHGQRVRIHVSPVTNRIDQALIGAQVVVFFELKDEFIQVEEAFDILNLGKSTWIPQDVVVELPKGFRAFNAQQQMSDIGVDAVDGTGVRLRGTFPPGEHEVSFRYQLPRDGSADVSLAAGLPPRTARMRVLAEATPGMSLDVTGFPGARVDRLSEGQRVLVTERQLKPGEEPLKSLAVSLHGLPGPGPERWYAVVAALLAAAVGVVTVAKARRAGPDAEALREDAARARDRLVAELAQLEKMRASGEVGPKSYEQVRGALLDALARALAATGELGAAKPA